METDFTTTIRSDLLHAEIEAHITYRAIPVQKEGRYNTRHCHEIEVIDTRYTCFGVDCHFEGKVWERLEWICQERAEEHFSEAA